MANKNLTLQEVAEYLKLTEKVAFHLVSKDEFPGFKVGGACRLKALI